MGTTLKDRFRRVPGEMSLSREWEAIGPEARFLWLQATVSPRQTSPGVYDGTEKGLAHETGIPAKKVKSALDELAATGVMREITGGGFYVRDAFRWSAANPDFVKAAVRVVVERWPSLLPEFLAFNRPIFERFKVELPIVPPSSPQCGITVTPLSPHNDVREVAVAVPEPEDQRLTPPRASRSDPPETGGNGKGKAEPPPPQVTNDLGVGSKASSRKRTGGIVLAEEATACPFVQVLDGRRGEMDRQAGESDAKRTRRCEE